VDAMMPQSTMHEEFRNLPVLIIILEQIETPQWITHQDHRPLFHRSLLPISNNNRNQSTMIKVSILLLIFVAFSGLFTSHAFDFFNIDVDLCNNSDSEDVEILGKCDINKFPNCPYKKEPFDQFGWCYNRKPSRQHFDPISHQPVFYIQYDRVLCYPNDWSCSSCTPGRYCLTEKRCILDEKDYPCAKWY
jgi:hypothetical protein